MEENIEISNEETTEEVIDEKPPVLDKEYPLTPEAQRQLTQLMKHLQQMLGFSESQWRSSEKEFKLTDTHMKQLYQFNEENRTPPPEDETVEYDNFNGLDQLSEEKVFEIFGEDHPIIGVQHSQTMDRIRSVVSDFFAWMTSIKEYRQAHNAFMELIEFQEDKEMVKLKDVVEKEQDPDKKVKMQIILDKYYNTKYLDFLSEPLDDETIDRLAKAFSNADKINYWIDRARDKLRQMKLSEKFILEISQFEKRFLDEKYHHQSNILLLYFISILVFKDVYNHGEDRHKIVCMVLSLDKLIRNVWNEETRIRILNNVIMFEDQFIGKLPIIKEPITE